MTKETLVKRIEGKKKEIDKLTAKKARIEKAQASGWKDNPYYYSESDLKWTIRDLEAAEKALVEYADELVKVVEKEKSRNVQAIIEFLNGWKARCTDYYVNSFETYLEELKIRHAENAAYCDIYNNGGWKRPDMKELEEKERKARRAFDARWAFIQPYVKYEHGQSLFDDAKLAYDLNNEANRKYDFIIERTNEIVGTITDASELFVGEKGDLNGYIHGEKATAKVQTIGAGGYNIQCFHFRTLIHKA